MSYTREDYQGYVDAIVNGVKYPIPTLKSRDGVNPYESVEDAKALIKLLKSLIHWYESRPDNFNYLCTALVNTNLKFIEGNKPYTEYLRFLVDETLTKTEDGEYFVYEHLYTIRGWGLTAWCAITSAGYTTPGQNTQFEKIIETLHRKFVKTGNPDQFNFGNTVYTNYLHQSLRTQWLRNLKLQLESIHGFK